MLSQSCALELVTRDLVVHLLPTKGSSGRAQYPHVLLTGVLASKSLRGSAFQPSWRRRAKLRDPLEAVFP